MSYGSESHCIDSVYTEKDAQAPLLHVAHQAHVLEGFNSAMVSCSSDVCFFPLCCNLRSCTANLCAVVATC